MKYTRIMLIIALFAVAAILAACGGTNTSVAENPTVAAVDATQPAAVDVIETNAESTENGADAEHNDGDEHAADTTADAEHNDGDEHAADSEHEHAEIPDAYADKTNPFSDDATAIAAGAEVYTTYCAMCHGAEGKGDGDAGAALDPKPADFTDSAMMQEMTDGYLFWRISEGGTMEPFNSAMPAWKQGLTEEQRWQVLAFIQTLGQ